MLGVGLNVLTVLIGSVLGLIFRNKIPQKLTSAVMTGIGICTLYIGISGALSGQNTLVLILSVALGAVLGTLIDIDRLLEGLSKTVESKFGKGRKEGGSLSRGFVAGSLLFCVGAMTITGSLESGISGNNSIIYAKSLLDLISSAVLSVSLGAGVLFSAFFVLVYQGLLVLLAQLAVPLLSDFVIAEMTCAGSVTIIALGLNIIGVTKIKVANYLPAIFMPIALCPLFEWVSSLL